MPSKGRARPVKLPSSRSSKIHFSKEDIFIREFKPLWEEYLTFGGYPAVVCENNQETKRVLLENIISTYIDRDIIGPLNEESISELQDLTRILAAQTGTLLNYQQLSSDTNLYYRKVKHFLSVLEETFLVKGIRPLHGNLTTELKKNPKTYFLDPGLRNSLVGNFAPLEHRPDRGELAESGTLANVLYNFNGEVLFWRTTGGAEVDFILRCGQKIFPVEVKYQSMTRAQTSRSLHSFIKAYAPLWYFAPLHPHNTS